MWEKTVVRRHAGDISERNQYHVYYLQMCMKLITYVTTNSYWQNAIVLHIATYFIRHIFVASDHAAIQKTCAQTITKNVTETAKTNNQKKTTT